MPVKKLTLFIVTILMICLVISSCSQEFQTNTNTVFELPQRTQQSYEISCGDNIYAIKVSTVYAPEQDAKSQLLSLKINGVEQVINDELEDLENIVSKLASMDFPPVVRCEIPNASIGIESYWSGTSEPVFLLIYFRGNENKITYLLNEENKDTFAVPMVKD